MGAGCLPFWVILINKSAFQKKSRFLGNLKTKGLCFETSLFIMTRSRGDRPGHVDPRPLIRTVTVTSRAKARAEHSVSPDNRAALHATASCFAIGYRDGLASPRPTVRLEFPIKILSTSPLTCSLQEELRGAPGCVAAACVSES